MKRKLPLFLVVLMSISLIGLMIIQIYWIENTVLVRKAVFKHDVVEALSRVDNRIEALELRKSIFKGKQLTYEEELHDELDSITMDFLQNSISQGQLYSSEMFNRIQSIRQKLNNNSLFLDNAYTPTETIVNKQLLDTLLSEELKRQGVETDFEFGVYSDFRKKMLIQKTGKYRNELMSNDALKFPILSLYNYPYPDKLIVYFPYEKQVVFSKIWHILVVSMLFVIIIIAVFTSSIYTIFKQKKVEVLKNDFINNMTHELKTPISTISLACQAMNDKDIQKTEELVSSYISIISDENQRLQKMVENVLQTALIDKGQMQLKMETVNIHTILADVGTHFDLQVKEKGGDINLVLEATNYSGQADKLHLTNCLFNLVDNAIKYTTKSPKVVIITKDVYNGLLVEIQDNGIGISKSNQKKIFQKLYRVHTGNIHNFKGFGLGLSYVKAIVDLHEGNVSLVSELRKGSTFKIYLPFTKPD
ncbi:MAG: sensor histidine kinase [Hyphomicrobiales bacterium]